METHIGGVETQISGVETQISGVEIQISGYYMADICFLILNVHQRRTRIDKRDGMNFGEVIVRWVGKG